MNLNGTVQLMAGGEGSGPTAPCPQCGPGKEAGRPQGGLHPTLRRHPYDVGGEPQPLQESLATQDSKERAFRTQWLRKELKKHGTTLEKMRAPNGNFGWSPSVVGKDDVYPEWDRGGWQDHVRENIEMHAASEAAEPPVGAYSRKHVNRKEDWFQPKPGAKGGVTAGGEGSGCRGPNCGRPKIAGGGVRHAKELRKLGFRKDYEDESGAVHYKRPADNNYAELQVVGTHYGTLRYSYSALAKGGRTGHKKWGAKEVANVNQLVKYLKNKRGVDLHAEFSGEPTAGNISYSHIDPLPTFHAPSNKKAKRVPTDDVRETDDTYGDVTKRKQAFKDRMKLLKRSIPGGLPPLIPVRTTLPPAHTGVYQPGMFSRAQTRSVSVGRKRSAIRLKVGARV